MTCPRCGLEPAEHPAGECLDRWVVEDVMGVSEPIYVHRPHIEIKKDDSGYWICQPNYYHGDVCEWKPAPFSTRIQDAWEVVEKLVELEHEFEISHVPGIWGYLVGFSKNRIYSTKIDVHLQGDEAPLAICRVAILVAIGPS